MLLFFLRRLQDTRIQECQEWNSRTQEWHNNKKQEKRLNDTGTRLDKRTNNNSFKISVKNQEIGLEKQNPQNFVTENPMKSSKNSTPQLKP